MILRHVLGWQVLLADLSLILFITSAATLDQSHRAERVELYPLGDTLPAAVYRVEHDDGPDELRAWIAAYSPDPRESLDITMRYDPDRFDAAVDRARELMRQAQAGGQEPRIILEAVTPGDVDTEAVTASFGFSGNAVVARELQNIP